MGQLPFLCRRCRHLTLVEGPVIEDWTLDLKVEEPAGRCSKCRRRAEPWPELDDAFEPILPAECPKCAKKSVRFEYYGIWD